MSSSTDLAITEKLLLTASGWDALKSARELFKAGRVSDARYEPPLLTGTVRERSRSYRAGLRLTSGTNIDNLCTCPESRRWGKICAHSVAVGLAHVAAATTSTENSEAKPVQRAVEQRSPAFVAEGLADAPVARLRFILPTNFTTAWERGQLMVVVEAETAGRTALLSALPKSNTFTCDAADLAALDGLHLFPAVFVSGMLTLNRAEFLRLLGALQGHPRLTFGKRTPAMVSVATYRPVLGVQQRGEQLSVGVELPGDTTMLLEGTEAWLLRRNEFLRFAEELSSDAATLIGDRRTLKGTERLKFLATELPRLRPTFDIQASEDLVLPEVIAGTPAFLLNLTGTINQLTAGLSARYGAGNPIDVLRANGDIFLSPDSKKPTRLLTRDLAAEQAALARLERSGFGHTHGREALVLRGQPEVLQFFAADYPRLEREWTVTLSAQVEKWSGEIERVTPTLEVLGSGEDWFEVRYSLGTESGQQFSSAQVQQLLRSGRPQTKLANGRTAVFDTRSLEDVDVVLRDCDPAQSAPGVYRIGQVHAGYLTSTAQDSGVALVDCRQSLSRLARDPAETETPAALLERFGSLGTILRDYQKLGAAWLSRLAASGFGGILADEMGLGKTLQTLAFLRAHQGSGPALVVCPTSLLVNWENEARRFTPELAVLSLGSGERHLRFSSIPDYDIVITSYALLRRDIEELRKFEFSTAILDEAQHIKNPDTQNAQAAYALRSRNRFVLTGTPMENSVRDIWAIMNFVVPGYLGTRPDFRERYEQPLARGAAPDVQRRLSRRLRPFLLRRRKRDVATDLPDKIQQVLPCDLSPAQRLTYDALLREIQQGIPARNDALAGAVRMKMLIGLLRLRQVCCDLRLLGVESADANTSAKLTLLDELLDEAIDGGHRVLIFSQFVSMLHLVRQRLDQRGVAFAYLDGQTKDRQQTVDRFQQDASVPVFLISLKAGGVGLNLSAADTVVHFDPWWNPAVEDQATDRAHRIGQKRVVTAYKLITRGTVEEKILRLQEKKRAAIDAAIDGEEPLMNGLTTQELEELLA